MGVIFDLDQTLLDTSIAEPYRKGRQWQFVYNLIPRFTSYPGVTESLKLLRNNNIPACIVTSSISNYCDKVIGHWGLPIAHRVCYHDTILKKPHPDPILKALFLLKSDPGKTLSLGDRDVDIIASNKAKVISVACMWGANDPGSLINANPIITLPKPTDMIELFKRSFGIY